MTETTVVQFPSHRSRRMLEKADSRGHVINSIALVLDCIDITQAGIDISQEGYAVSLENMRLDSLKHGLLYLLSYAERSEIRGEFRTTKPIANYSSAVQAHQKVLPLLVGAVQVAEDVARNSDKPNDITPLWTNLIQLLHSYDTDRTHANLRTAIMRGLAVGTLAKAAAVFSSNLPRSRQLALGYDNIHRPNPQQWQPLTPK